jgi:hypothetical protein
LELDHRDREPRRKLREAVAPALVAPAVLANAVLANAVLGCVVAFVIVAPWMRRGWLLLLDWAPGPRALRPLGGSGVPSGPVFLLPAELMHALFGAASSWLPIFVVLAIATAGAARMIDGPFVARAAAGVAYGWNPFVFDRLAVGQISVLAGYALLPWLLHALLQSRRMLVVAGWWGAAALCSLHFLWIGGLLVGAVAVVRGRDGARVCAGAGVIVAAVVATWLLVVHAGGNPGDARALQTFGTTPDADLGRSLGLLAEQGFWRTVVTRPRDDLGVFFPFVACVVVAAAGAGLVAARSKLAAAVAIAGGAGWLLAHGDAGPVGLLYRVAYAHLPGFGVMREAQKWDALVCLAIAAGLGSAASAMTRTCARRCAAALVGLPLLLAPTLAWGLAGRIEPSRYPASWRVVDAAAARIDGDIVVLPWQLYVRPGIAGNRTIADPVGSYFGHRLLVSRDPDAPGLEGDTGRRAAIGAAVRAAAADAAAGRPVRLGAALARLGVGGVLVVDGAAEVPVDRDRGLARAVSADHLALFVVVAAV